MAGQLPDGDPVPDDGALPPAALESLGQRPFGIYVHVPFCATRCGYCDFNTYTALELGGGADAASYAETAAAEIRLAAGVLSATGSSLPRVSTVFVGGGTPTLLPPDDLGRLLRVVADEFGLAPDVEVTTEANPESVDAASLSRLREQGFTRVSFGMQSAREHVLRTLDRVHTPGRPQQCVVEARAAGFDSVSLDLIYGTPGESDDDWVASLETALSAEPDHVSAYALVVEDGTALARKVARGDLSAPDDDVLADRYLLADEWLARLGWYEVSNWGEPCRHNLGYWTGADWWGIGPGAHSAVGGVRWWNVKHPTAYAGRLAAGRSPGAGCELLTPAQQYAEHVLLRIRLRAGLPLADLDAAGRAAARVAVGDGLLEPPAYDDGLAVLTLQGRLLADRVVRALLP